MQEKQQKRLPNTEPLPSHIFPVTELIESGCYICNHAKFRNCRDCEEIICTSHAIKWCIYGEHRCDTACAITNATHTRYLCPLCAYKMELR